MRSDMESLRAMMSRSGIHAQPIEVITHETSTILGLSLSSDDYIYNMAAQNEWAETHATGPPSTPFSDAILTIHFLSMEPTVHISCNLVCISVLHRK